MNTLILIPKIEIKNYIEKVYKLLNNHEDLYVQLVNNNVYGPRIKTNFQDIFNIKHNHRKIGIFELVFDIDCNNEILSHYIWQNISNNLEKEHISHSVWFTSRTYHIHCFFNFKALTKEQRRDLRLELLKHYSQDNFHWLDKGMCSEDRMIRDFNTEHEITGKINILVYWFEDKLQNPLNPEVLTNFLKRWCKINNDINKPLNVLHSSLNETQKAELVKFLTFAQSTPFLKSGMQKNNLYFKNIAIACYLLELNNDEIKVVSKSVAVKTRHNPGNITSWVKWCRNQKKELKVNWKELILFYGNTK